jgi:hypothetical protein
LQRRFWDPTAAKARQLFIIASGARPMSKSAAATRGDRATDLRDRNQSADANLFKLLGNMMTATALETLGEVAP